MQRWTAIGDGERYLSPQVALAAAVERQDQRARPSLLRVATLLVEYRHQAERTRSRVS